MRWNEECTRGSYSPDTFISKEILYNAFQEELINWNTYQKAIEKINANRNGDWMFVMKTKNKIKD